MGMTRGSSHKELEMTIDREERYEKERQRDDDEEQLAEEEALPLWALFLLGDDTGVDPWKARPIAAR